jgi:pimeloyl-ACP methyl ester carboxylesterase
MPVYRVDRDLEDATRNRFAGAQKMAIRTVVLALLFTVSAAPIPGFAAPEIKWTKCPSSYGHGFTCGTLDVPLDYENPDSPTIGIALARLRATGPDSRLGTILLNPGGPGGSGVNFVVSVGAALFSDEVRARFDIIGFDPRGIHRSNPLKCFVSPVKASTLSTLSMPYPLTPEEVAAREGVDDELWAACGQRGGEILHHMSTVDVARDLDLLRQAVGDQAINYAGYSYGSFLGNVYANLFPDRVRALMIDGIVDPVAWTTGRGGEAASVPFFTRLRSDAGAQATLDEFFRLCDAAEPGACAFAPNSAARFAALGQQLLEHPLTIVLPSGKEVVVLTYPDLIAEMVQSLYDSSSWQDLAVLLARIEARASAKKLGSALQAVRAHSSAPAATIQMAYPYQVEGYPGVACSDSVNPESYSAWPVAAADADANYGYFGSYWTWVSSICQPWEGPVAQAYLGPFDHQTANPVLVVGNRFDPATRYESAQFVAGLLPNSRLLTLDGWGHTSLFLSACVTDAVSQYFLTGVPPADGTVCNQDFVPFPSVAKALDAANLRSRALREIRMPPGR